MEAMFVIDYAFNFLPPGALMTSDQLAAPGCSFGPHTRSIRVFYYRHKGKRRGKIDNDPKADKSFREKNRTQIAGNVQASHIWTLQPCDILYLPPVFRITARQSMPV